MKVKIHDLNSPDLPEDLKYLRQIFNQETQKEGKGYQKFKEMGKKLKAKSNQMKLENIWI